MISANNLKQAVTHTVLRLVFLLFALAVPAIASANENEYLTIGQDSSCGSIANAYGPYDYTNPSHVEKKLPIVERFHFTRNVETLASGNNSVEPGGDLDYTLRAFPNHHRALYAMIKYHVQSKSALVAPDAKYPTECYLIRANKFSPRDANVYLLYGLFLVKTGRPNEAVEQYEKAIAIDPNNAEAHYNLGLLYLGLGSLDGAARQAEVAYELGYPLPGLKRLLQKAGAWGVEQ